jgi:hypothetical protein
MTPQEIQMCVADVMQDDDIENVDSILRMLNNEHDSWRRARGSVFTITEVHAALKELIAHELVTPCAKQFSSTECSPIPTNQFGTKFTWDRLWFHLETAGRSAVRQWWETEGCKKYPLAK